MSINTRKYIEKFVHIRTKDSQIIPLKFNKSQLKLYDTIKRQKELNKPVRIIILKARQLGFSTATEAIFFKETATKTNVNTAIVAHKEDSTTNLFNMTKLIYNELPDIIKPQLKASNAKELIFNTKDGKGLNSKIKCMTAGGEGVGRSDTINNLHLSELAFWQGNKKQTLLGLLQAVPNNPNSIVVIESTANGYEYFKELWDNAVAGKNDYVALFVGWNELEEYQMPYSGFELTNKEKELQIIYNLSFEQLAWRRWAIENNCGGDEDLFAQEYPINPEEAFISTGKCYFDKKIIIDRIQQVKEPIKRGSFIFDYDELKIKNIKFKEDKEGPIKIYKMPERGKPYVLGGDTAGEGSDYFTGNVDDNITGEQVAVLKQQYDEIDYTRQMYCLGIFYNTALIGIESNYTTYPIEELTRLKYPKQYVREKKDSYTNKTLKSFGFKTTMITRPLILANLQTFVKENIEMINDKETLEEMLTFIKNENGRPEAQEGYHDDLVMGKAISLGIRSQQTIQIEEIKETETKLPFELQTEETINEEWY